MSAIDATKPVEGNLATTASVRANFLAAKNEIDAGVAATNAHNARTDNPHATTAAQVGADATGTATAAVAAHVALGDPHTQYATDTDLTTHTGNTGNPHSVTKAQIGLGNADNTSDANKPVSTAQAAADTAVANTAASNLAAHTGNASNPHSTTAAQVGAPSGSGTSTGTNTGDQTTVSGNAGTATALQTARTINGTSFDGTANITINAVDATARVPATRTIATTAPLTGGGDLSADRTLAISAATSGAAGSMSGSDKTKLDAITGTNTGDQTITLTGDVTGSGSGSFAATIAASAVTLAKMASVATGTVFYRKTAATGAPEVQTLATLKTDLALTGTNSGDQTITLTGGVTGSGTSSFAATVVTNANLTGEVTSSGNATTVTNAAVIGKVLTGYTSGAGTVAATDTVLQAIQKLNGNDATNANLTGPITSTGNATAVAAQTGTGSTFVMQASPTLTTPNLGTPSAGVMTNVTGTAAGLTAGNSSQLLGSTWAAPGTIGSTTRNTGAFTALTTTNDATINGVEIGRGGGAVSTNTGVGVSVLASNTTGDGNTAYGYAALALNDTGQYNTANGYLALYSLKTITGIIPNGNTVFGYVAGFEKTNGSFDTILGYNSGRGITTGGKNTIIGANVTGLAAALSNNIIISDGDGVQRIKVDSTGLTTIDGPVKTKVYTVATLPSASTMGNGARSHVSDAVLAGFGTTVSSGGSFSYPVYSDGTNWKIG